jgi:sugar transferase (PEP-CTERM/EpsH1 system associated)
VEPLLFLCHRIPYPPNKGEKMRAWNLLKGLAESYRVSLACFVDDPADWQHREIVARQCANFHAERLDRRTAKLKSVSGLLSGEPLTLPYYRSAGLARWVDDVIKRERIERAFVYSSAMADYVLERKDLRTIVDLVDVDSDKWAQFARASTWPMSWVYAREARMLLNVERRIAQRAHASLLVTDAEVALFRRLAPESVNKVFSVPMGVDVDHYAPRADRESPFGADELPLVFTGVMDYRPNVDAAVWFARDVLPGIALAYPKVRFYVVGMNPAPAVQALAQDPRVVVTGRVPDTRPYLQHARVVVAPLRIVRGVQTKVLEAMAMGRPVVVAAACAEAVDARAGEHLVTATTAQEFTHAVTRLLGERDAAEAMGRAGRVRIAGRYTWPASVAAIERLLSGASPHVSSGTAVDGVALQATAG